MENTANSIKNQSMFATVRHNGILSYKFWTHIIDTYCIRNNKNDEYHIKIHIELDDALNVALFGKLDEQVREYYGIGQNMALRDTIPLATLNYVDAIELLYTESIKESEMCPLDILSNTLEMINLKPRGENL